VRDVGRQGQGPGEYTSAPYLRALDDGTLVMRELSNARISFFSADGEYVDSFPATSGSGPIELDPQGNLYLLRGRGGSEMVKYSVDGEELGRIEMPPREIISNTFVLGWEDEWAFPLETVSAWSPLLGSVVVPERLRPFAFRGDRIWGAIIDEDGIEKVVRLRAIPETS
jgi:hypothetical protein